MKTRSVWTALGLLIAFSAPALGVTDEQKCQKKKLLALGKLDLCMEKEKAKEAIGKTSDTSTCQTRFQKQLASAEKSGSCRWLENSDATVATDLNTGLQWELKNLDETSVHYVQNTYVWSTNVGELDENDPNGPAFFEFLGSLNNGNAQDEDSSTEDCFDGSCDWRMPTLEELKAIAVEACSTTPCTTIPGETDSAEYWTLSNTDDSSGAQTEVWTIDFSQGCDNDECVNDESKASGIRVRAVRGVSHVE